MNPYVRIAIAAMAAVYLTPPIINRFVGPEVASSDVIKNDVIAGGVTGIVTAAVFVVLGMAGTA